MRGLLAALLAVLLPSSPTGAQERGSEVRRAELASDLLEAWSGADPQARRAAIEILERNASPGRAMGRRPALGTLAQATRALSGEQADGDDDLQRFADSIDLAVVPGVFDAAQEGRGMSLSVRVFTRDDVQLGGELDVSLIWIGPQAQEIRARTEPFPASAFRGRGFWMYIRAPLSDPGWWQLVPQVEQGGTSRRGFAVPVECSVGFHERFERLRWLPSVAGPGWEAWVGELERLVQAGQRMASGIAPSRWLERKSAGDPWTAADPVRSLANELPAELDAWGRVPAGLSSERDVLLFVASHGEAPAALFHGPTGAAWARFAERQGADLISVRPVPRLAAALTSTLALLRAQAPRRRVFLVARGDAVTAVELAFLGAQIEVDGLCFCAPIEEPGGLLPDLPVLLVSARVPAGGDVEPAGRLQRVAGRPFPILDELDLPLHVERWLSSSTFESNKKTD